MRVSGLVFCAMVLVGLAGCASSFMGASATGAALTGNWQFASAAAAAVRLPAISGSLSGGGQTITGLVHADGNGACVAPATVVELRGAEDSHGVVTLAGALAGGTLTITGTEAADGKSLSGASYSVSGGSCGFTGAALATAKAFTPINGNFAGSFADASGPVISITATLNQTPAADTSGNFQLSGTAAFADQSCFSSPLAVSNTQVSGGNFTLTYTDSNLGNTVTANGMFSSDGTMLMVTSWNSTGSCGTDAGTGSLLKQ